VSHNHWEEGGVLAPTQPTTPRPAAAYPVAESVVTLSGPSDRAGVGHSRPQAPRRPQPLARELQASAAMLAATVRDVATQEYCWRAEAEAAAEKLRALPKASHQREGAVEERPQYGPGRPSRPKPRPVKARRYGLRPTCRQRAEVIARKRQAAACFVRRTHVPTTGARAPRAGEVLRAYTEPHGVEQNCAFLQAPLLVKSLFLKQPARIEALGMG
jgi:hypothetical protein